MRVAVLGAALLIAACGSSATPQARSSFPPSATPSVVAPTPTPTPSASPAPTPTSTSTAGSPLTWSAPVRVIHQPPFLGNRLTSVSCPSSNLCVAVDDVGNAVTSTNPAGGASAWTVTNVDVFSQDGLAGVSCPTS